MKLAAAWYGFREETAGNYFGMAAGLGLRYVEVPLYWQIIEDRLFRYRCQDDLRELREAAEKAGVRMVSGVSNFPLAEGAANWRGDISRSAIEFGNAAARRAIDIAGGLGLEVVRVIEPDIRPEMLESAREYMEACGRAMRTLAERASGLGMLLAVENYGLTSRQVNWLLDAADHPAIGTLYDPCNYHRIGEDPLDALKNLGRRVNYCHLKDAFFKDQRSPETLFEGSRWPPSVAVGEGEIDWAPIVAELGSFYDGYMSIEYEMAADVMRGTRVSIEHIRKCAAERGA